VRVTEAGQRYLDDARRIIAEVDEADEAAAGTNAEPRGHLAVTAPALFGKLYVMPGIVDYLRRYPAMEVSATLLDRVTNLLEEGFDVGIRIGELPDSSMQAIGVGQVRRVLCAAPAYLALHGEPQSPAELARHTIIASSGISTSFEWKFQHQGQAVAARVKPRLVVNTNDGAIEAARQGLGVVRLMSYQVAALVAAGELTLLLRDYEPAALPVNVVHREGRRGSARLRSFIDLMVARLRADATLN
jgi:DNA-binding transcriptional LysR family regulator